VTAALSLCDLHFAYGRGEAVRGVSLVLAPGDCYGFLGHNGAGKTTVMRLALGLLRPRRGEVRIFGADPRRDPAARAPVGAIIERPGFHLHATARANLHLLARLQGLPRRAAATEGARVLEQVGLAPAGDRRVGTFSVGMRQRLGVAQALLGRPRLLLLDEPTNALDPEGIADLRALLLRLTRDDGVAVLVSSHQLAELDGLCNRVGVMREGAMVVEGDLDKLRRRLAVRHIVAGTPLPALRACLEQLGLAPEPSGDRLMVALQERPPGAVVRALAAAGELHAFAPEPTSLEAVYLRADRLRELLPPPAGDAVSAPTTAPAPTLGNARRPWLRAFAHELRLLSQQRSTAVLLLLPCAVGVWRVFAYRQATRATLERVQRGELFSADSGSGYLATALALETATPLLALGLLWLASQAVAADLAGDTLRNTLVRSVRRRHVLLAKFTALAVAASAGFVLLSAAIALAASATLGFGDLEEVTRLGDRQVLADARDVAPLAWLALRHGLMPLLAVAAVGLAASTVARRPARALLLALLAVLGVEVVRDRFHEHAGWLLTSHVPTGLRDDSVFGYFAAGARGAADALWPYETLAVATPLVWIVAALLLAWWTMRRLRVA